ncbi:transcriptional regulator [Bradyrhizobium lupini HPC(L)]|uniref:Transcriptional regulator n=1 Tax=Bradyrhizobium lupini HPC(L) TaxID=1229491 RepID=A0ABN0HRG5_RHILU|nr:transcriptional regulator [Bradyrhizobium lupini HPC(L)]
MRFAVITPAQCRAARALLEWNQPMLAAAAGVSPSTIRDFESGKRTPIANNLASIRGAFEAGGVMFIYTGETAQGHGVTIKA